MEFKARIAQGETLCGTIVTLNLPSVGEVLSECGFDWLWIDMEHAPFSLSDVQAMLQAKNRACGALVRIPVNSEEWIKRVLDLGVEGIIIPHVNTAEEAKRIIDISYYPPQGCRSVGMSRANRYGLDSRYKQEANEKRGIFVQIEDKEGVANIEEIAKLPGIDGIIIGPTDLSGSYGKLGQVRAPEVVEAIEKVLKVCKRHKKPIGIFAKEAELGQHYIKQGFQLVAVGIDVHYLWTAAKAAVTSLKS
ncbi:MAG: 2,4-dihydroxyhept-2-ene-1,7-dioic acid aldolase [Verrucomicrobia bacterium]|nr:2,4-dihydroxyhept-2-ene-1,7-dioic acid aldolase [Verrucomicrobiota bacterium]